MENKKYLEYIAYRTAVPAALPSKKNFFGGNGN